MLKDHVPSVAFVSQRPSAEIGDLTFNGNRSGADNLSACQLQPSFNDLEASEEHNDLNAEVRAQTTRRRYLAAFTSHVSYNAILNCSPMYQATQCGRID